jgi:hypothetical protein
VPASAKHSQTMSKDWYAETCIPYGLRTATPVAVYSGGPTPSRRRLNIHGQCPKIGMQKPAYPTDCIPIGADSLCTGPSPSPASPATAWRFPLRRSASPRRVYGQVQGLGMPHTYLLGPIGWQPQSAPALVFDKKTRGRIGDGFSPAEHLPS